MSAIKTKQNHTEEKGLHIKNSGAHATAWQNTRSQFLEEYGFEDTFFEDYKSERKQAEKEFSQWKEAREKELFMWQKENEKREQSGLPPLKYPKDREDEKDLWRHFDLTEE